MLLTRLYRSKGILLLLFLRSIQSVKTERNSTFSQLINSIDSEKSVETLLVWKRCLIEDQQSLNLQKSYEKPIILFDENANFTLSKNFNSKILAIFCLEDERNQFNELVKILRNLRDSRVIIQLKTAETANSALLLKELARYCFSQHMLNVIFILSDYQQTDSLYTYQPYPELQLARRSLHNTSSVYFPQKIRNLYGFPLRTYPDQIRPDAMCYRNKKGELEMLGYIGRLITTYAERINATLTYALPVRLGRSMSYGEMLQLIRNGTVDIPASVAFPNSSATDNRYSYVTEIVRWYAMVPVAQGVKASDLYWMLFNSQLFKMIFSIYLMFCVLLAIDKYLKKRKYSHILWLELFFNMNVVLALTGGPLRIRTTNKLHSKLLILVMLLAGLLITTMLVTHLKTFMTYRPVEAELNTFDDLRRNDVKLLMSTSGITLLRHYAGDEFVERNLDIMLVIKSLTEYDKMRYQFNSSMAYGTMTPFWSMIEHQQKYFARKVFRLSQQAVLVDFLLLAIPLPDDSIFEKHFNEYITQLHATGIYEYWFGLIFYDMIKIGEASFKDLSNTPMLGAVTIRDFYWIWLWYFANLCGAIILFVGEVCHFKFYSKNFKNN